MFNAQTFGLRTFAANTFIGTSGLAPTTISIPIKRGSDIFALTTFDYWIINADDELIASGTVTTDADGLLGITLSAGYAGQTVNVVVNNLAQDMNTAGKWQKQFVVTI